MPILNPSPFICGQPVDNEHFVDREADLQYVLGRLLNQGQSTAITGEPHIGKTSLLTKIADPKVRKEYLGDLAKRMWTVHINLHGQTDLHPKTLWQMLLAPIEKRPGDTRTSQLLKETRLANYMDRQAMEELFKHLAQKKRHLVVLLDEFEALLPGSGPHPNFANFSFFALFRALDAFSSYSYVTTSRLPVKILNERAHNLTGAGGSPVFNTQIEWKFKPFDDQAVGLLLSKGDAKFTLDDKVFIRRFSGGNPFLAQSLGEMMWQFDRLEAVERFYDAAAQHFDDLWNNLDNNTRTTAVILSLAELNGLAQGRDYAFGEIEQADRFGPELNRLRELGLAECVEKNQHSWCNWILENDKLLVWRGERWGISAKVFTWWVRDVVISETRYLPSYKEWLNNKEHKWLLTKEQWGTLSEGIKRAPNLVSGSIRVLVDAVWAAIQKKGHLS